MKFLIPLLICIPLAFLNCERNRVSTPPVQQHTPPAQQIPWYSNPGTAYSGVNIFLLLSISTYNLWRCLLLQNVLLHSRLVCRSWDRIYVLRSLQRLKRHYQSYLSFSGYLCYGGNRPITPWHSSTFMEPMQWQRWQYSRIKW